MQIFELVKKMELDVDFNGETCRIQIELFRHAVIKNRFRCRLWRLEFFRIQPSFPQNKKGNPRHSEADEGFLVNWDFLLSRNYTLFEASTTARAIQIVMCDLKANLDRSNTKKSKR
jgi:hypothetical protein